MCWAGTPAVPIAAGSLTNLAAFPSPAGTIFSNPVLGTLSGAGTQFVSGQAGATYNAGATPGAGSADATADGQTVTASITVQNTTAVGLTAFSGRSSSDSRTGLWLLAGGILGLGGLWLARRRRQTASRADRGRAYTYAMRSDRWQVPFALIDS